jgi:ribonucleoside-diphosphate reductase alpha chain
MISLALRHGTQPSFLIEQLQKDPDNDLSSFSKVVARVLKTYVKNGTKVSSDKVCPSCQADGLVYQDGCPVCSSCGWSRCG